MRALGEGPRLKVTGWVTFRKKERIEKGIGMIKKE